MAHDTHIPRYRVAILTERIYYVTAFSKDGAVNTAMDLQVRGRIPDEERVLDVKTREVE